MSLHLLSVGTAVPERVLGQHDAEVLARGLCCSNPKEERLLHAIYRGSGIEERHVVLPDQVSHEAEHGNFYPPMHLNGGHGPGTGRRMERYAETATDIAVRASREALASSGTAPQSVTHLVTASCTGFRAPGVDVALIRELGLPPSVKRVNVGFMGCHGALNALRVARAIVESQPEAVVLVCAAEICSLHFQYGWDVPQVTANALFGDGAAAFVATGEERAGSLRLAGEASQILPGTEDLMTWEIGNYGFRMFLSPEVPRMIGEHLAPWLRGWLEPLGIGLEDVRSWGVHPGGPRILTAVRDALGIDDAAMAPSVQILRDYGNMSSPTILFILRELIARRAEPPTVLLGFGPGLTFEGALLR